MKPTKQNPAIARYMAALKRAQNAPTKRTYPKVHPLNLHGQEAVILYVKEFCSLNQLVYVPPVFWSPPEAVQAQPVNNAPASRAPQKGTEAMNTQPQTPAVDRAMAVLRTSLGIVQTAAPQEPAAPVAAATAPKPAPRAEKAVAHAKPPRKAQAKAAPQPAHDVWFYFNQQRARAERRAS